MSRVMDTKHITKTDIDAMLFAVSAHSKQKYGEYPYSVHLGFVNYYVNKYKHLLSNQIDVDIATQSGWLHDIIEDCPAINYEILKSEFGERIANTVRILTNVNGVYNLEKLKGDKVAFFVKLCDRLANVSFLTNINFIEKTYDKYVSQSEDMFNNCPNEFKEMIDEMKSMFNNKTKLKKQ